MGMRSGITVFGQLIRSDVWDELAERNLIKVGTVCCVYLRYFNKWYEEDRVELE